MLDRITPPSFQTIQHFAIPQAHTLRLANGVPLHLIKAGEQAVLRLEIIFRAGTIKETKPNAAYLMAKMLIEGTKKHSATYIAEFFEQWGASIDTSSTADRVKLTLYCLSKFLPQCLPLIAEILQEATMPEAELQEIKHISLQQLKVNLEKTSYLASKYFRKMLFQAFPPYASWLEEDALQSLTSQDLQKHYAENILAQPFEVFLTGHITDEVLSLVEQNFATISINANESPTLIIPESLPFITPKIRIPKEQSLQASVRVGKMTIPKKHPDYLGLAVLNEILGGYFGSRLMKNIREEKGFTYGISAQIAHLEQASFWTIGTDINKDVAQITIDEIYKEMHLLQTQLVEKEELSRVQNYMLGSFAALLNTAFDLADIFKGIHFHGLTYDFYQQYIQTIQNITPDKIQSLAQKYLKQDDWLEVVVGV